MAQYSENEVVYYYDSHPTEEDLMGESSIHADLVLYLMLILRWLFHRQRYAIFENLNFYQTANPQESPLTPDIAVIKGAEFQDLPSWRIGKNGPAPQVVFEIGSSETWIRDLEEKPALYTRMGVQEYFAYDPHKHLLPKPKERRHQKARRLFGWRLDPVKGEMYELPLRSDGSLWSIHLESLLVPEGQYLRLYDSQEQLRLTQAETLAEKLCSLGIDPDQL